MAAGDRSEGCIAGIVVGVLTILFFMAGGWWILPGLPAP